MAQVLQGDQPQGLPYGASDMGSILQQPAFASLKATQDALQPPSSKQPQQKDIDNELNHINQTIANLVDGLGKGQMSASPADALQGITNISKVIDNSLSEALNFEGNNAFKAGGTAALMQGQQQKKALDDMQLPPMDLNGLISDTKGSYPGLLDDL